MKKYEIMVNGIFVPATKGMLFAAWSMGQEVGIYQGHTDKWIQGLIYAVICESGYFKGQSPKDFLVSISTSGTIVTGLYVRTQD